MTFQDFLSNTTRYGNLLSSFSHKNGCTEKKSRSYVALRHDNEKYFVCVWHSNVNRDIIAAPFDTNREAVDYYKFLITSIL